MKAEHRNGFSFKGLNGSNYSSQVERDKADADYRQIHKPIFPAWVPITAIAFVIIMVGGFLIK